MPRLKKREEQKQEDILVAKIKYAMALTGVEPEELAVAARISPRTLQDRMQYPGTFKVRELCAISKKVKIPVDKLLSTEVTV